MTAELVFGGDFFLTGPLPNRWSLRTERVAELMRTADLTAVNLENGLSAAGSPELGGFEYGGAIRGPPGLARELPRLGVDAVSLANNHTGNYGRRALLETVRAVESAGVASCGAGTDLEGAFAPTFLSAGGIEVALISAYSLHERFVADDRAGEERAGIACMRAIQTLVHVPGGYDTAGFADSPYRIESRRPAPGEVMAPVASDLVPLGDSLRAAADRADLVVLSVHVHWGRHQRADLPAQQRSPAAYAFDAGADVVIGHGPHVLRGVEHVDGKICAYSLGNVALRPEGRGRGTAEGDPGRQGGLLRCVAGEGGIETCEL